MSSRTTLVLTGRDGVSYRFVPGALCLELVCTGGEGERAVWESLHRPADLAAWARASGLAALAPVPEVRVTSGQLRAAKEVRELVWRMASAAAAGRPWNTPDVAAINAYAARPPLLRALGPSPGALAWGEPFDGARLVAELARDAVELLGGVRPGRLRQCAADDCRLLFFDASRAGARRWCSMERCGNRAKVSAHRLRAGTHR
jgi:predicted RNA-binding Zn ribbon-like protein